MSHVERDPGFRNKLIAAYKKGDLTQVDVLILESIDTPDFFASRENALALVFALELWAAVLGDPHPALPQVDIDWMAWCQQRLCVDSGQTMTALGLLAQSPWGPAFSDDVLQLLPRLFKSFEKHEHLRSAKPSWVWIFCGAGGRFPSGVFHSESDADAWIQQHQLTGTLTQYPVGTGTYDWAVENEHFKPKKADQATPDFIQRFSWAGLPHRHYTDGRNE